MKTVDGFVVFLFFCFQAQADHFQAFEDGKKYIYEYKTRVATGIAKDVKQISGFGFKALLTAQSDGNQVAYQMSELKYGYFNEKVDRLLDEIPIDYERLPDERVVHVNNLEKPFWVEYDHGLITAIYFTKGEDVAKHNNKKALASIFQLYLEREGLPKLHLYSKKEDSISGVCESMYSIGHFHHGHHHQESEVLNVTKVRQYEKCENVPHLFHSTIQGYKCTACEHETFKPLKMGAHITYSLKGTREKYVIEHITASGGIDFTPFTPNGQSVLSVVNQTFELLRIEDAPPIEKPTDLEKHEHLAYEFNNDFRDHSHVDLKEAHFFNRVYPFTHSNHVAEAEALYHQLEEEFKQDHPKVSKYVTKFIDAFSEFDYHQLEAFFNKYVAIEHPRSAQHLLLEILPLVGTNPAILYTLHIIEKGKIDDDHANEMVQLLPFYVKEPSLALIEVAKEFGAKPNVVQNYKLYISSHLAYGTLLFKSCQKDVFNPHPHNATHYVSKEKCSELIQELIQLFNFSDDTSSKLLNLRTISNTRSEEAFNFLLNILHGEYSNHLKQVALWGINHAAITLHKTEQVVATAYEFLTNIEEDYVLRAYAFDTIIYFAPTPQFFGSLVLVLEKDPNEKLKSFIYNSIVAYANSTEPCFRSLTPYFKHFLQYIEARHYNIMKDTVNKFYFSFDSKFNFGRSMHFIFIPSNESILPRELYFRKTINLLGYSFNFLEAGYSAQGQTFPEEILGVYGLGPPMLVPHFVHKSNSDFINKTIEKFHINNPRFRAKYYEVYVKLFNQDMYVTDDLTRSLLEKSSSSEFTIDGNKATLDFNSVNYVSIELLVPNELGMPVVIKSRIPATVYIHGSLLFSHKTNDEGSRIISEEIAADLLAGCDIHVQSHVAVLSVLFGPLGYKLTTKAGIHLPIRGSVGQDYITNTREITYIPSTEPYDIFYYKTVPETVGKTSLPIHISSKPVQKEFSTSLDYFGVGLIYNFTFDQYPITHGSYRNFFKDFIKKSTSNENYYYLSQKWYGATRNLLDHALWNPTGKNFAFNIRFTPSPTNPTTKFVLHSKKNSTMKYDDALNEGEKSFSYKAELLGKGSVERKWNVGVKSTANWPERNFKKVSFYFKRSPIPNYDEHSFEICYTSNKSFSDMSSIYALKPAEIKILYNGQITFGQDCQSDSHTININAVLEQSEEQLSLDRSTLPLHKKCAKLIEDGYIFNDVCWEVMKDLGRIDKITVDIDYENISPRIKGGILKLFGYFRHRFYNYLHIDPQRGSNAENHIQIVANTSYHDPALDVKILYPHQIVSYKNIYIPSVFPTFEPFNIAEDFDYRFYRKFFNYEPPVCYITGSYVRTFDEFSYKVSLSKNYHLAFSDFKHVFVFVRGIEGKNFHKALYAYADGVTVEITPQGDSLEVTVDDEPGFKEGKTVYFFRGNKKIIATIYKFGDSFIYDHQGYGFVLYFDGNTAVISASYFYKASQHGICGNFDGEPSNEFQGYDGKFYENASDFINSYAVEK